MRHDQREQHRRYGPAEALPPSREISVVARDGVRLHTVVFGPEDGYPVVLSHGITCSHRVWVHQIADLAEDFRVIAYDHRGHGRSDVPTRRSDYSLDHLGSDLDAVLEATLAPGERAVIAGHSMGGIAITAWAERHPEQVRLRADGVALINTSTGHLLHDLDFLVVPPALAQARVRAADTLLRTFGSTPMIRLAEKPSRLFVSTLTLGRDADPAIADFVYSQFEATPAKGRGGWLRTMIAMVDPRHIDLSNLTVPTLVIGSEQDRILPIASARRIAENAPNLAAFVELPGGHCAILERPHEVNKHLRELIPGRA